MSVTDWERYLKPGERRALETLREARAVRKAELAEITRDITTLKSRAQGRARSKFAIMKPSPPPSGPETRG